MFWYHFVVDYSCSQDLLINVRSIHKINIKGNYKWKLTIIIWRENSKKTWVKLEESVSIMTSTWLCLCLFAICFVLTEPCKYALSMYRWWIGWINRVPEQMTLQQLFLLQQVTRQVTYWVSKWVSTYRELWIAWKII